MERYVENLVGIRGSGTRITNSALMLCADPALLLAEVSSSRRLSPPASLSTQPFKL